MTLTPEEKRFIHENEVYVASIMLAIQKITVFKVGDFLIAYENTREGKKGKLLENSYGATKKFQVVVTDSLGIPYMKELNKNGTPIGRLICPVEFNSYGRGVTARLIFEVDPDYADSIILDDQANYNAVDGMKSKSDAFKAVAKHNKAVKINNDDQSLIAYIKTLKVGDVIWRSHATSWIVQNIEPLPKQFMKANIAMMTPFLTVKTNKGIDKELSFLDLKNIVLYKDRPRTYKELKDPK